MTEAKALSPPLRWLLLGAGLVAVLLAVVGIFLPVLPTVPFLLLAVGCFARSSERFHTWLLEHNHLGPLVRPYLQGEGIPRKNKVRAIILVWLSIGLSVFLLNVLWVKIVLVGIAIAVTLYLIRLPEATGSPL
jgi:hypothetical protein